MRISKQMIEKKRLLCIPVSELWRKWTTHEGLLTFFGADNRIELSVGGEFEIYFLMDEPYGRRGSEGCRLLSYLPERFLSFSWNAPPQHPEIRDSEYKTWVVIEFSSAPEGCSEIRLTHLGWPDEEPWIPVYEYFDAAWDRVLDSLEESIK